jgi:hypothetical protein
VRPFLVVAFAVLALATGAAAETSFTTLDVPGAPVGFTEADGINDRGDVVGTYRSGTALTDPLHGFLLHDGSYTTIDVPGAHGVTFALGINAQGDVVGGFLEGAGTHGFVLRQGGYTALDAPGARGFTSAAGINAQGDIVGRYQDAPGGALHGFLLRAGSFTTLDFPGAPATNAFGIDDAGDVVGSYVDTAGVEHGFLLRSGSYSRLDAPKALSRTVATGINANGDISGYYLDRTGALHGFLRRGLNYSTIDGPDGPGLTRVLGINARDDLVGTYSPPQEGFLLAATSASAAPDATKNAGAACTALQAKMGRSSFAQAFAPPSRCSGMLLPLEQRNIEGAQVACKADQDDSGFPPAHGGKTFEQFYGGVYEAFGNCVSAATEASSNAERQERANPAATCRSLRTRIGAIVFARLYGKRALRSCLAGWAAVQITNELRAAAACRREQDDGAFAAGHGGRSFAQLYGTDPTLSDAFGRCAAAKAESVSGPLQGRTVSAAKACSREEAARPRRFRAKYGSFAHCVAVRIR